MNKFKKSKIKAINKLLSEKYHLNQQTDYILFKRLPGIKSLRKHVYYAGKLFNNFMRLRMIYVEIQAIIQQPIPKFPLGGIINNSIELKEMAIHHSGIKEPVLMITHEKTKSLKNKIAIAGSGPAPSGILSALKNIPVINIDDLPKSDPIHTEKDAIDAVNDFFNKIPQPNYDVHVPMSVYDKYKSSHP